MSRTQANEHSSPQPTEVVFVVGTVIADEPVTRDAPTGPLPTQQSNVSSDSDFDGDGDGFYTFEELERAVAQLIPNYDWPERYQVAPELVLSGFAQRPDDQWEVQYEYTLVGVYQLCAWERTWIDAYRAGDTTLMENSLDQVRELILSSPVMHVSLKDHLTEAIERAELGDPTLIQQDVDSSCQMEWATPQPGTPQATVGRGDRALYDLGAGL